MTKAKAATRKKPTPKKTEVTTQDGLKSLVNNISGLGGANDSATAGTWHYEPLSADQIEKSYRSNWLAGSAIDIPAFDMFREGWTWEGDNDETKKIETECKRLGLRKKLIRAKTYGDLYGGAGIFIGDGSPSEGELTPENVRGRGLKYATVLSRWELSSEKIIHDPTSPYHGEPEFYYINTTGTGKEVNQGAQIHPSRVIRFEGRLIPRTYTHSSDQWGDSVLDRIEQAIRDATSSQQAIAHLIQEASVDVMRIEGFMDNVAHPDYERVFLQRLATVMSAKSLINAVILDKQDEYDQKTANFSGLPDVVRLLLQIVSGASDIPATRFLGQSPAGMNSTGESDLVNYYDALSGKRELEVRPSMERLFDFIVPSATGKPAEEFEWSFNPLWQMSDKERAEIDRSTAETARIYADTGLIDMEPLRKGVQSRVIEDGTFPALEQALEEYKPPEDIEGGAIEIQTNPETDPRINGSLR